MSCRGRPEMICLRPRVLHYHITSKCPFGCVHCCSDAGPRHGSPELEPASVRRMLDKAVDFGMDEFELSGGEPLTLERHSLFEIIAHASGMQMVTTLSTNTWFLDKGYALALKDAGLDRLKTSLYGTTRAGHDAFTGMEGSFERLMNMLGFLREMEIEVWVNYVVTPKNLGETADLARLLDSFGLDTVQVSAVIPTGRGAGARGYLFGDQELHRVLKGLRAVLPDTRESNFSFTITLYPSADGYPFGDRYCDYLTDRLVVNPSGRVVPCCVLPQDLKPSAGSVLEEDFPDLLSAQRIEEEPVFRWLARGHKAMEEGLAFRRKTPDLCAACIAMLRKLVRGPA